MAGISPSSGLPPWHTYLPTKIVVVLVKRDSGAIVPSRYFTNTYGDDHELVRPYASFPHDWQAVRILMGYASRQADRGHLNRYVDRGNKTQAEAADYLARMRQGIATWERHPVHETRAAVAGG